ncbi:hypothetical protein [Leptospira bouyouniensis]|uniref:Uncharacterized protein n=1 Tax=Leptospira bouyouniensis TaxID=2484911 RepID=A0ABY2KZ83_9LEPT|nr:hypothetical protein [Leptospira bouyouniensis]TGK45907.1 hypothetical protein EHQ10_18560 [Leptospira bouyouniensis]
MSETLPPLPPSRELELKAVFIACVTSNATLAELKGVCGTIPNDAILFNALATQEAKGGQNYSKAWKERFRLVNEEELLTSKTIITIKKILEIKQSGFRKQSDTVLRNEKTGATQNKSKIWQKLHMIDALWVKNGEIYP